MLAGVERRSGKKIPRREAYRFESGSGHHLVRENPMFRVWSPVLNKWIEDVPLDEALVYKEEGYVVLRMDLPFTTPPK